jgi:transcriptional regulator with XRE-family HTH domain
MTREMTLSTLA